VMPALVWLPTRTGIPSVVFHQTLQRLKCSFDHVLKKRKIEMSESDESVIW
jgi:hypothetical protein